MSEIRTDGKLEAITDQDTGVPAARPHAVAYPAALRSGIVTSQLDGEPPKYAAVTLSVTSGDGPPELLLCQKSTSTLFGYAL